MIDILTLSGSFLGFAGGLLSFVAGYQAYYDGGLGYRIRTWRYDRQVKDAIAKRDKQRVEKLQRYLPAVKIYSPDFMDQALAIDELHNMAIDEINIIKENVQQKKESNPKKRDNSQKNNKKHFSSQRIIIDFAFGTLVKRSGDRPGIHKQCEEHLSATIKDICGKMRELEINRFQSG